jgi:hypothetical protein
MPEENFRICADEYMMLYALYLSNVKYIDEPLAYYRIHGNNAYVGHLDVDVKFINARNFATIRRINEKLIGENQIPIPYMNQHLRRLLCENEEKFMIEQKDYVIYGTGAAAINVREYLEFCGANIKFYCDSNEAKWGGNILSPEQLVEQRGEYYKIVIASMWINEISETLNKLGLEKDKDYIYSKVAFW